MYAYAPILSCPGSGWRIFLRLVAAGLLSCGAASAQSQGVHAPPLHPRSRPVVAVPLLVVPEARLAIQLARVQVDAEVVGLAARTRIEMEFRNPNDRALEGELQFPLRPGQAVTGFALDIDGALRPAVPVEKAKGRQVFEEVTRTRVDPALLEAAGGNNYKLRVYPLPAGGTRRVVLEISETLMRSDRAGRRVLDYQLPLQFGQSVQRLDAAVRFPGADPAAVKAILGSERVAVQRGADGVAVVTLTRIGYTSGRILQVTVPAAASQSFVSTQTYRDATYFYAELPVALKSQPRPAPANLAIVWDASGSGAARDHARELAVLDGYFSAVESVAVQLLLVRDVAEPVQRFQVTRGDWRSLREQLEKVVYDGATNMGAMAVPDGATQALLFTDGLGNFGGLAMPASGVPLHALSSSISADAVLLRHAAEASGGTLVDLLRVSAPDAVRELRTTRTRLAGLRANGATDLVSAGAYPENGRLVIAGRLTGPAAHVELEVEAPDGTRANHRFIVAGASVPEAAKIPLAAYRWATLKLAALEADRERNRSAIRRLGTRFGLLTAETSLIVLDAVADYARYEIEPPESLRPAYERLIAQKRERNLNERATHLDRIAARFVSKQAWWDRAFPKDEPPQPKPRPGTPAWGPGAGIATPSAPAPMAMAPRPVPAPAAMPAPSVSARMAAPPTPTAVAAAGPVSASIQLKKWLPDAPYARRLREARVEDMYAVYLDERPSYLSSTAFFLDAADILLERGQTALGLRVLSNLAEMNLENRQILRILAYRLKQAGQVKLALPVLQKVLVLSPDEPQSLRDLGLALAEDGQSQAAVNQLWEVVARPWNNRFPDIELIALGELNAINAGVAAAGQPGLDTSAMDTRLLRNLPLDVRAVLSWDADNTDIDLWVIDPNGERAYYGRQLTYQGGRMSNDFTGGYGPEEFVLRDAKPGIYTVKAEFYGHNQQIVAPATTLMLRLSTGFGTPAQKDENIILRLAGKKEEVTVGTFVVGVKARP